MTGPDVLRNLHRTPPATDWWTIWWRQQKRRHRTHVTLALIVGVAIGRWTR